MSFYDTLNELQQEIENAAGMPLTSKAVVDRDNLLDLIDELREQLPKEVAQAIDILKQKDSIIDEARRRSDSMIGDATARRQQIIDSSSIVREANETADFIVQKARLDAINLRSKSIDYAMKLMSTMQEQMGGMVRTLDQSKIELFEMKKTLTTPSNISEGEH